MIGHIIIRVVGDDEVRLRVLDELDHLVAALGVVGIDVKIVEHSADDLYTCKLAGLASLIRAHGDKLLRRNHHMTQRPVAKMCDHNLISALDAFGKRTGASDFNIIGMATNGKNIHFYRPLFVSNYDITLPRRPQASIPAIQ